jgi:hypothetical protein
MKKFLILLLVLLLLGGLIWLLSTSKPVVYQPVTLSETNGILNTTPYPYLDTVVDVGLTELGVAGLNVLVQPMSDRIRTQFEREEGAALEAYIAEWLDGYVICVNGDLGHNRAIDIMAHELWHLSQYQSKRLVLLGGSEVLWLGTRYDVLTLPYAERPWEREAFREQGPLARAIRQQLLP